MAHYNLVSAAAATGKTKSTILKAIKTGRISANRDDLGGWAIDPAELHRVYPLVSEKPSSEPRDTGETANEIEVLKARLEAKDEQLRQIGDERDHLRDLLADANRRVDAKDAQIAALLPAPVPRRGLFGLFRR